MQTYLRFPGHQDNLLGDFTPEEALEQYEAIFQMTNFDHVVEGKSYRLDHNFEAPISEGDTLIILFKERNEVFE